MKSQFYVCLKMLTRILFATYLLCSSGAALMAQGYVYTFEGFTGYPKELDGSYVILSNIVPGPPTLADLLAVKILDSFGGTSVFDVTVSAAGFDVTSFNAQGFNGSISGIATSYLPSTGVTFEGIDSTPAILSSNNGFFPGNPAGY